jgi:hypothetical protein
LLIFLNTSSVYPRPSSIFSLAGATKTRPSSVHLAFAQFILIITTGLYGLNIIDNATERAINSLPPACSAGVSFWINRSSIPSGQMSRYLGARLTLAFNEVDACFRIPWVRLATILGNFSLKTNSNGSNTANHASRFL